MLLQIDHITRYSYSEPASGIVQKLRLTPRACDTQQVVSWRIDVDADGRMMQSTDAYGNICHVFYADKAVDGLVLHVTGTIITNDTGGLVNGSEEPMAPLMFRRTTALTAITPGLAGFAETFRRDAPVETLHALMLGVNERMQFEPGITDVVTDADTAFRMGRGVCQDLSQIFIAGARHLGFPARYVSGHYAATDYPEQEAAHAWAEAYVPNLGWVAFDPTHGVCATESHVRVAVGLDSLEASPVRGSRRGGGLESLAVGVHGRQGQNQGQTQGQSQAQA